jgi:tRNA-splicing ligase RtcB
MRTIDTERVPILVWGELVDEATLAQAQNLANLPFAFHHVALMADAHVGYGMPIGGVLAAEGQVIPHAVGLDIGCGVRAWRTNIRVEDLRSKLDRILSDIQRSVPQGFHWHARSQAGRTSLFDDLPDIAPLRAEAQKAAMQIGSLGGGNHFLELQADPEGVAWAMIHSGSRNVGKQLAEHYDRVAKAENRSGTSLVPPEWGLAHLPIDSDAGAEYLRAMNWALEFAHENRRLMAESVQGALDRYFDAEPGAATDIHHNYASIEEHLGTSVVVHRKGAVHAEGTVVVPGSMGTASYIAEGLANPLAFASCSHGAGRAMGRKAAERALPRHEVMADLTARGVTLLAADKRAVAEEAPAAYKDIEDVMRWQADLVTPRVRLTPVGVVKG